MMNENLGGVLLVLSRLPDGQLAWNVVQEINVGDSLAAAQALVNLAHGKKIKPPEAPPEREAPVDESDLH
jgi:hypothetical protein